MFPPMNALPVSTRTRPSPVRNALTLAIDHTKPVSSATSVRAFDTDVMEGAATSPRHIRSAVSRTSLTLTRSVVEGEAYPLPPDRTGGHRVHRRPMEVCARAQSISVWCNGSGHFGAAEL